MLDNIEPLTQSIKRVVRVCPLNCVNRHAKAISFCYAVAAVATISRLQ